MKNTESPVIQAARGGRWDTRACAVDDAVVCFGEVRGIVDALVAHDQNVTAIDARCVGDASAATGAISVGNFWNGAQRST
ncbi:hypothetical protein FQZ97_990210 [compost metagenome]